MVQPTYPSWLPSQDTAKNNTINTTSSLPTSPCSVFSGTAKIDAVIHRCSCDSPSLAILQGKSPNTKLTAEQQN